MKGKKQFVDISQHSAGILLLCQKSLDASSRYARRTENLFDVIDISVRPSQLTFKPFHRDENKLKCQKQFVAAYFEPHITVIFDVKCLHFHCVTANLN